MGQQVCMCLETQEFNRNHAIVEESIPTAERMSCEGEDTSFVQGVQQLEFSQKYEEPIQKAGQEAAKHEEPFQEAVFTVPAPQSPEPVQHFEFSQQHEEQSQEETQQPPSPQEHEDQPKASRKADTGSPQPSVTPSTVTTYEGSAASSPTNASVPLEEQSQTSQSKENKKKEMKVLCAEFRSAATAGISCTHFDVDRDCITRTRSTLFLKDMKTIKIVSSEDPEQFFELRLDTISVLAHDRMKEYNSENQHASQLLKELGPEEEKRSAFFVHGKETVCVLLDDSDMSFKTTLSLRVFSDFARAKGKGKGKV